MLIYKLTNTINNKCYIGQTFKSLDERIVLHLQAVNKGSKFAIHCAIRKYKWENFTSEIIENFENISSEELTKREQYWVDYYDSYWNGYNLTQPNKNPMYSEKVKNNHLKAMRSKEVREKISNSMKRSCAIRGCSTETRQKISSKLKGNQHGLGKKRPLEAIEATVNKNKKKVYCIDINNNVIKRFDSVKEAWMWFGNEIRPDLKNPKDIIKESAINNKYINGLKWIYE